MGSEPLKQRDGFSIQKELTVVGRKNASMPDYEVTFWMMEKEPWDGKTMPYLSTWAPCHHRACPG